ncbi:MAG: PTS sugar transporter subunit IIA [Verrucomicrobiales bacterium]
MMLADLFSPECVIAEMQSDEQIPSIAELVDHLVDVGALSPKKQESALNALRAREEQRSTGIGGGIAIPHCFLAGIESVITIFGRSNRGIDFCSLDRAPVHFVVLFIVPEAQHNLHLKTLAAISKILNSAETRSRLAEADGAAELYEILSSKAAAF